MAQLTLSAGIIWISDIIINSVSIFITLKSLLISKIYLIFRVTAKRAGLAIAKQIALAGGSPPDCQVNL